MYKPLQGHIFSFKGEVQGIQCGIVPEKDWVPKWAASTLDVSSLPTPVLPANKRII